MRLMVDQAVRKGTVVNLLVHRGERGVLHLSGVALSCSGLGDGVFSLWVCVARPHSHRMAALGAELERTSSTPVPQDLERVRQSRPPVVLGTAVELSVEAGDWLVPRVSLSSARIDGGVIQLPVHSPIDVSRAVVVSVSLGPGADTLELAGIVSRASSGPGVGGEVWVRVAPSHRHRVRYLFDVSAGVRGPTKRKEARLEVVLGARLTYRGRTFPARAEAVTPDGLFVRCHARAQPTETFQVQVVPKQSPEFTLFGAGVWVSDDPDRPGFGARILRFAAGGESNYRRMLSWAAARP